MMKKLAAIVVIGLAVGAAGCTPNHAVPLNGAANGNVVIKRTGSLAI